MTSNSCAASATVFANGPIWSRLERERDEAVAADPAVGGLHPDHAAQRGGLADRATRVGAEREGREARGHGRRAAPARAARHPGEVAGVAGGAERRVLGGRAHGELVEVRLADGHRAGGGEALHDGGVVGREPAVEDLRRAGGGDAPGAEVVLEGDRHPGERPGVVAGGHRAVDLLGRGAGLGGGDQVEGVDLQLGGLDGGEVLVEHVDRRPGAAADGGSQLDRGRHGASPRMVGTEKRSSATAGAAASTSSRSRVGPTTSARSTLVSG